MLLRSQVYVTPLTGEAVRLIEEPEQTLLIPPEEIPATGDGITVIKRVAEAGGHPPLPAMV